MVFGVLGAKLGPKNVRNLHLFAFLRTFAHFCALFHSFCRSKIVETKFNKGGMSAVRTLITNYELRKPPSAGPFLYFAGILVSGK